MLEFNFTYLQILFSAKVMYESSEFIMLRRVITELFKNDEHSKKVCFRKLVSLLTGVIGDINKDKFKDIHVLRNRVFLVYKVSTICDNFIETECIEITPTIDVEQYELFVNNWTEGGVVHECLSKCLNSTLKDYIDYEHEHFEEKSKDEIKTVILMRKLQILRELTLRTLEDN